ncbi:asparaginyl-tRNA synthetase, partial [Pisolithus croceorrhizus]
MTGRLAVSPPEVAASSTRNTTLSRRNVLHACSSQDHFDPEAQYDVPAQSATKKAKKDAQGLGERRLKVEAEERGARERQRRGLKKVWSCCAYGRAPVIVTCSPRLNKRVRVCGWLEAAIVLKGTLKLVPEGHKVLGGYELLVDYWKGLGPAPGRDGAFTNKLREQSDPTILAHNRHLVLRGETAFNAPPFYGSFPAENSSTRHCLSEYTHLGSESTFINFDNVMSYIEAIANIAKDVDGKPVMVSHAVGDRITETAERHMTDIIREPISSCGFPEECKAFYVQKMPRKEGEAGPSRRAAIYSCQTSERSS